MGRGGISSSIGSFDGAPESGWKKYERVPFGKSQGAFHPARVFCQRFMDGSVRIGILGTGVVGQTIGGKLVELGHDVKLGSRTATNERAAKWVAQNGARASQGTFADAASFAEMVFN